MNSSDFQAFIYSKPTDTHVLKLKGILKSERERNIETREGEMEQNLPNKGILRSDALKQVFIYVERICSLYKRIHS